MHLVLGFAEACKFINWWKLVIVSTHSPLLTLSMFITFNIDDYLSTLLGHVSEDLGVAFHLFLCHRLHLCIKPALDSILVILQVAQLALHHIEDLSIVL